jgi:hypothetical protein
MTEREILPDRRLNETQESERDGIRFTITTGFKSDGTVGEIFLNAGRVNSALDVLMRHAAIICSIALQFGVPLATIAHALKRDRLGVAESLIGAAIDRVTKPTVAP